MALQPDHLRFSEYFRAAFGGRDQLRAQGEYLVTLILTAHSRMADVDADLFPDRVALSRLALGMMGMQTDEPDWLDAVCSGATVDLSWANEIFGALLNSEHQSDDLMALPQTANQREALRYALAIIQPVNIDS